MDGTSLARRALAGACAAALLAAPGFAQQSAQTNVTTVAPLTVMPALPQVGAGATYLSPEELSAKAEEARMDQLDARFDARGCLTGTSLGGPTPEDVGDFGVGALSSTENRKQYLLHEAAEHARAATEAALAAVSAFGREEIARADLEKAELARQDAVRAYQQADRAASEAHYRMLDLLELADRAVGGNIKALRALELSGGMRAFQFEVEERSRMRASNSGGRIYADRAFADLRLAAVKAQQQQNDGKSTLRVSGKIVNTRRQDIAIPPLWVEALDRYGTSLETEQFVAPGHKGKIPAGGSLKFDYTMTSVPEKAARANVTFAPNVRMTPYLVASIVCGQNP